MDLSTHTSTNNWYALRSNSRAEKKVAERLIENGFETYLPLVTTLKMWSDRKKKVQSPLISSFVFIKTDKEQLIDALNVQGVAGVLRFLGKPAIIPEHEINNMKILLNEMDQVKLLANDRLKKGEEVEVVQGPFAGLLAEAIEVKGKYRVVVNIAALGAAFSVNIPMSFVQKRRILEHV